MRSLVIAGLTALTLYAQDGPNVNIYPGAPLKAFQYIRVYSGNNMTYFCLAESNQAREQTITVSAVSNANPASVTATAHGFDYQSLATTTPAVSITGGTGAWAAFNGTWIATPTGANTFTIPVDTTAFGAVAGTLVFKTRAPLTTSTVWSIQKFVYDASGNLIWTGWATSPAGAGNNPNLGAGTPAAIFACASRTTYGYQ